MTNKQILKLMKIYHDEILSQGQSKAEYRGSDNEHVLWMLQQITEWSLQLEQKHDPEILEKMHRWLGFVQGFLWTKKIFTIDEMKSHNFNLSA